MSRKEVTEWLRGPATVNPSSHSPFYFAAPMIGSLASLFPGATDISDKVLLFLESRTRGNIPKSRIYCFWYFIDILENKGRKKKQVTIKSVFFF